MYYCYTAAEYYGAEDKPQLENVDSTVSLRNTRVHVRRRKRRCGHESTAIDQAQEVWSEEGVLCAWDGPEEVLLDESEALLAMTNSDSASTDGVVANRAWQTRRRYSHVTSVGISPNAQWLTYQVNVVLIVSWMPR